MKHLGIKFLKDQSGIALTEFALIMPIAIVILTGVIETANFLQVDRKVVAATHATADLVTLDPSITQTRVDDIMRAAELVLQPYSKTTLKVGVASVRFDAVTGTPALDWQNSYNGGTVAGPTTLATGMGAAGESVVIVSVTYTYKPILASLVISAFDFSETAFARPRRSSFVTKI